MDNIDRIRIAALCASPVGDPHFHPGDCQLISLIAARDTDVEGDTSESSSDAYAAVERSAKAVMRTATCIVTVMCRYLLDTLVATLH